MTFVRAFIGLGSNLDEPLKQVESAISKLNRHTDISVRNTSPWYVSKAVGPGEQPDYINGVAELNTTLSATALLLALQNIENQHGRQRIIRWGSRTLDLDLLWYDNQHIDLPNLHVPHPRIYERNFVLFPLRDIAPDLILDGQNTVHEHSEKVDNNGIRKL